ncbi:MAG: hypothetical protein ABFS56_27705 [Pseudomonadota bacterium]
MMGKATQAVEQVYGDFLKQVVIDHVLEKDRKGQLSENMNKRVAKKSHIDSRLVRLMTISGKGGWHPDPKIYERYAQNYNITLLDHLLSVTRGSLMLASLDWLSRNPDMEDDFLKRKLYVMAAIAFMHDLDKDLELPRNTQMTSEDVEERMSRYGIADFLAIVDVSLMPDQLLYLIEKVEATQSHRTPPAQLPPRDFEALSLYVRLADKLDGAWVSSDPKSGGLKGVLARLAEDQGCLHSDFLRHWQRIDLFDPHHPFLLDELQRWLSLFSRRLTGPLLEVHQDGRLFMLLPESKTVVDEALKALCKRLPFQLELNVSNRGVPALFNGQPSYAELKKFIADLPQRELSNLFKIKAAYQAILTEPLDELLDDVGLNPSFPKKSSGALVTLYAEDMDEEAQQWLQRAAYLALLLNLKLDAKKKAATPAQRETALLDCLQSTRPDWLVAVEDDSSRRILTALWAVALADEKVLEVVWDSDNALVKRWLEGADDQPGFNRFITGRGAQVIQGVERHFRQLLSGKRVVAEDEEAMGRCLFTDQPTNFDEPIKDELGLYGVRVSAFSGRDNRPESPSSDKAHTNVSLVSIAEHKLRAVVQQGGKQNGVPTLISSPITSGLFGGLALTDDKKIPALSLYDLSRLEVKKGKVLRGMEVYQARYRMARLERMAEKTKDQVNQLRMLLKASCRLGRPLHVFRGLPTQQRAFFYYDAMPRLLSDLIGGNALRLEQIVNALEKLEMAQSFLETNDLGYDVLRLYANPKTSFGAICLACCVIQAPEQLLRRLKSEYLKYEQGDKVMTNEEGSLVKLGQIAAGIQKSIGAGASASEQLLVFKLCLDAVNDARKVGEVDKQSLIYAVAGELEHNLIRKGKAAASKHRGGKSLSDACLEVANLFVNDVWFGVLKAHAPSQRNRRILGSIYRMAFLHAPRNKESL